ncbi:MAG: hypothetical protein KBT27_05760 [Prevotellaceae bacterium]|nr:hypothetical protein [Candidatus Faecinaster equi]
MSIESRNVVLRCPTCGNDQFSCVDSDIIDLSEAFDETKIQCADCKCIITRAELLEANQDIIDANIEEVTNDVMKDFEKKLKKMFK